MPGLPNAFINGFFIVFEQEHYFHPSGRLQAYFCPSVALKHLSSPGSLWRNLPICPYFSF
jgi:hypothetical protein